MKSFEIDKRLVYGAWERVRANRGAPGVDAVGIAEFADEERDNLYMSTTLENEAIATVESEAT
ncbi:MAG: hypothetical protein ACOYBY_19640, partial [Dermatophilaceae bacterium]